MLLTCKRLSYGKLKKDDNINFNLNATSNLPSEICVSGPLKCKYSEDAYHRFICHLTTAPDLLFWLSLLDHLRRWYRIRTSGRHSSRSQFIYNKLVTFLLDPVPQRDELGTYWHNQSRIIGPHRFRVVVSLVAIHQELPFVLKHVDRFPTSFQPSMSSRTLNLTAVS
jgi:hypothetical protein